MSDIITTLKEKGTPTNSVYPNIVSDNIPNNAITNTKIADGSITTNKIVDGAITTNKIVDGAITINKLENNAKNAINNFNSIYDADLSEITVDNLELINDAQIGGNVNIDNDLRVSGRILDSENNEIKGLFNHSISATLQIKNTTSSRAVLIHFISSYDDNITTLNELVYELGKKINLPIYDNSNDIMGVLVGVDANNNEIEIFCGDGNGGLTNYIFDTIILINDDIYSI